MQVLACDAPLGVIEPAPITSLPLGLGHEPGSLAAFWSGDDKYFLRVDAMTEDGQTEAQWYRIASEVVATPAAGAADGDRAALARQMLDVIPMGGGRIAFPVGSTGRTIYRVWRSKGGSAGSVRIAARTRILGVRAGRSLRRPA